MFLQITLCSIKVIKMKHTRHSALRITPVPNTQRNLFKMKVVIVQPWGCYFKHKEVLHTRFIKMQDSYDRWKTTGRGLYSCLSVCCHVFPDTKIVLLSLTSRAPTCTAAPGGAHIVSDRSDAASSLKREVCMPAVEARAYSLVTYHQCAGEQGTKPPGINRII